MAIDPLAEDYGFQTPYAYAANNPIIYIDENGENPILGAGIGAGVGAIVGFFSTKGSIKDKLKGAGKGALTGAIGGALIGSGVGIAAFIGGGTATTVSVNATFGFLAGTATSITSQLLDGNTVLDEDEMMTDALIGIPANLVGAGVGNIAAKSVEKQFAKKIGSEVNSGRALRQFKKHAKRILKDAGVSGKGRRGAVKKVIKELQKERADKITAIKVRIQTGTARVIDVATEASTGQVDQNVGSEKKN